jgi:hypothetical protein
MATNGRRNTNAKTPRPENRRGKRYPFNVEQRIAEIVDGQMPAADKFESVQCIDISRSGFAFYSRTLPQVSEVIVALGKDPDIVYVTARVVQSRVVKRDGQPVFRVGCHFTGRLSPQGQSLSLTQSPDAESAFRLMSGEVPDTQAADSPTA